MSKGVTPEGKAGLWEKGHWPSSNAWRSRLPLQPCILMLGVGRGDPQSCESHVAPGGDSVAEHP